MFDDDEQEDDDSYPPDVNGPNGIRIMREQCSTCIYRPGNLMQLRHGRVADMTRECRARDTNVVCHQTLSDKLGAFCRGSVDAHAGQLVRIGERLNSIELVEPTKVEA